MKKKRTAIIALIMAAAMSLSAFAVTGCNKKGSDNSSDSGNTETDGGNTGGGSTEGGGETGGGSGEGETGGGTGGDEEYETPVSLTENTALSITVGETRQLSCEVGTTFSIDDNTVATVDSTGNISAKTSGVAKITATTGTSTLTCTVVVLNKLQGSSEVPVKDPFTFVGGSIDIGSVETDGSETEPVDTNADEYTVTYSDGAAAQYVTKGSLAVEPTGVYKDGYYLKDWVLSGTSTAYDFSSPVTSNLNLAANWGALPSGIESVEGNFESIAIEWNGTKQTVQYSLRGQNLWTTIDTELVRAEGNSVRADILGLKAGYYDVKVGSTLIEDIYVKAYDRSGYAHYNRERENFGVDTGVGAYNDDGTLKDNAIVIYVTDENKDTVMRDVVAKYSGVAGYEDLKMFQIPYCAASGVEDKWNGKDADGIGWWLNNAQYTMNNANSNTNNVPSNTYDATNGSKLGFRMLTNNPVVIRFIGTVETPEGCTAYDCEQEGGSNGDNGHMARMKNCQHITLEGVGDDAQIHGWGIHFMGGTDATGDQGMSFEVRNLTFYEYPEDALGMEGVQDGTQITGPVERVWVHHNTFLPGHCANPAESDKAEGDGSCDFKRGQYFTCSYNWFEYCHKTNLVGSSDTSLQFNMTYHHNVWWQCGSRIPLARQANIHFYNNYIYCDSTETSTPYSWISKPALSYVHSLRANCYIYSEYNYYDGCKNVTDGKAGGKAKGWQNVYYSCFSSNTITEATTREQTVSGSCSYSTYDYSAFDTDSTLFYYDSANKKSDCLLDDSIGARRRALTYAGASGHGLRYVSKLNMASVTPSSAVTVGSGDTSIDLASGSNGVQLASTFKSNKGKGQLIYFTLTAPANLKITGSGSGDSLPQIIRSDGKLVQAKFTGTVNVVLGAGTYIVSTGQKDKESTITEMVFSDTAASSEARVNAAKSALSAIPQTVTRTSGSVITAAGNAYAALTATEREQISDDLYQRYLKAKTAYDQIEVNYAIARIDYIGTVTEYSKSDIDKATEAYNSLSAAAQAKVTNYATLAEAQAAFAQFAAVSVVNQINILPVSTLFVKLEGSVPAIQLVLDLYNDALEDYNILEDGVKGSVSNIADVNSGIAALQAALAAAEKAEAEIKAYADFVDALNAVTDVSSLTTAQCGEIVALYNKMSEEKQAEMADNAKFAAIKAVYDDYAAQAQVIIFANGQTYPDGVSVSGNYKSGVSFEYDGTTYDQPLKLESSTSISITTTAAMKVTIKIFVAGGQLKVNGEAYQDSDNDGLIVIDSVAAGTISIAKGSGDPNLCYVILEPAS